jgi:hypothetical protein
MTRETVLKETPAKSATSLIVVIPGGDLRRIPGNRVLVRYEEEGEFLTTDCTD